MENKRRRMIKDAGLTNAALALHCGISERMVTRWVAGESVSAAAHRKIVHALDQEPRKKLLLLLNDEWQVLLRECPEFCQALSRIAGSTLPQTPGMDRSAAEAQLLDRLCEDIERDHGRRILSPALTQRQLGRHILTHEQLDHVETFFSYILLFIVNGEHHFSINVDGDNPMLIEGVSEGEFVRLLIHYTYPDAVGAPMLHVANGEIQPSEHNLYFKDPVSAETSAEDAAVEFLYQAAERLEPAILARALDEHADKSTVVALEATRKDVRAKIDQRNTTDEHILSISGANTPTSWAVHLKKHTLPELRVAQLGTDTGQSDNGNSLFNCEESKLRALIVHGAEAIVQRRQVLESKEPRHSGAIPMNDSRINISDSKNINVSTGDGASNYIENQMYTQKNIEIRSLLDDLQDELQKNGQEDSAKKVDALKTVEDQNSFIKGASELVQSIEKPLTSGSRLFGMVVKLKTWVSALVAAGAGTPI